MRKYTNKMRNKEDEKNNLFYKDNNNEIIKDENKSWD